MSRSRQSYTPSGSGSGSGSEYSYSGSYQYSGSANGSYSSNYSDGSYGSGSGKSGSRRSGDYDSYSYSYSGTGTGDGSSSVSTASNRPAPSKVVSTPSSGTAPAFLNSTASPIRIPTPPAAMSIKNVPPASQLRQEGNLTIGTSPPGILSPTSSVVFRNQNTNPVGGANGLGGSILLDGSTTISPRRSVRFASSVESSAFDQPRFSERPLFSSSRTDEQTQGSSRRSDDSGSSASDYYSYSEDDNYSYYSYSSYPYSGSYSGSYSYSGTQSDNTGTSAYIPSKQQQQQQRKDGAQKSGSDGSYSYSYSQPSRSDDGSYSYSYSYSYPRSSQTDDASYSDSYGSYGSYNSYDSYSYPYYYSSSSYPYSYYSDDYYTDYSSYSKSYSESASVRTGSQASSKNGKGKDRKDRPPLPLAPSTSNSRTGSSARSARPSGSGTEISEYDYSYHYTTDEEAMNAMRDSSVVTSSTISSAENWRTPGSSVPGSDVQPSSPKSGKAKVPPSGEPSSKRDSSKKGIKKIIREELYLSTAGSDTVIVDSKRILTLPRYCFASYDQVHLDYVAQQLYDIGELQKVEYALKCAEIEKSANELAKKKSKSKKNSTPEEDAKAAAGLQMPPVPQGHLTRRNAEAVLQAFGLDMYAVQLKEELRAGGRTGSTGVEDEDTDEVQRHHNMVEAVCQYETVPKELVRFLAERASLSLVQERMRDLFFEADQNHSGEVPHSTACRLLSASGICRLEVGGVTIRLQPMLPPLGGTSSAKTRSAQQWNDEELCIVITQAVPLPGPPVAAEEGTTPSPPKLRVDRVCVRPLAYRRSSQDTFRPPKIYWDCERGQGDVYFEKQVVCRISPSNTAAFTSVGKHLQTAAWIAYTLEQSTVDDFPGGAIGTNGFPATASPETSPYVRRTVEYMQLLRQLLAMFRDPQDAKTSGGKSEPAKLPETIEELIELHQKSILRESILRFLIRPFDSVPILAQRHDALESIPPGRRVLSLLESTAVTAEQKRRNAVPQTSSNGERFLSQVAKLEKRVALVLRLTDVAVPVSLPPGTICFCLISAVNASGGVLPPVRVPVKRAHATTVPNPAVKGETLPIMKWTFSKKKERNEVIICGVDTDMLYIEACYQLPDATSSSPATEPVTYSAGYITTDVTQLASGKFPVIAGSLLFSVPDDNNDDDYGSVPHQAPQEENKTSIAIPSGDGNVTAPSPPLPVVPAQQVTDSAVFSAEEQQDPQPLPAAPGVAKQKKVTTKENNKEPAKKKPEDANRKRSPQPALTIGVRVERKGVADQIPPAEYMPMRYVLLQRHVQLIALIRDAIRDSVHHGSDSGTTPVHLNPLQVLRSLPIRHALSIAEDTHLLDTLEVSWAAACKRWGKTKAKDTSFQREQLLRMTSQLFALRNVSVPALGEQMEETGNPSKAAKPKKASKDVYSGTHPAEMEYHIQCMQLANTLAVNDKGVPKAIPTSAKEARRIPVFV